MLKIRMFLVAVLFAYATFSVTSVSASDVDRYEISSTDDFPVAEKSSFDNSEEDEIPFQEELDMDTVVVYPPSDSKEELETYTVVKGDNLSQIAKEYNISLDALMSWNNLKGDLIHPGDVFIINGNLEDVKIVEFESSSDEPSKSSVATVTPSAPPPPPISEKKKTTTSTAVASGGEEILVTATAYTAYCKGCSGTTAYGIDLRANPDQKVIAVDPTLIPLGTKVWVEGYGEAIAGDTGGAIKGNKIDVFIASEESALAWGVKKVKIKVMK